MTAEQIMNESAMWQTLERTAAYCDIAILLVTNNADWWDSDVLDEDTLDAEGFMEEVTK